MMHRTRKGITVQVVTAMLLGYAITPALLAQVRSAAIANEHDVTVRDATSNAFSFPSPLLPASDRRAFSVGNAIFRSNWVTAPSATTGLDGLGPLFNARSCSSCHLRDGRSRPPADGERDRHGLLVRIGVRMPSGADAPHPLYGAQVQDQAIPGVQAEARVEIEWPAMHGAYQDGEAFELIAPRYELLDLAYGRLGDNVVLGGRVAPQMIGLGLLESIRAEDLQKIADPDDRNGDGISGRIHWLGEAKDIGRFGWKATQPTVAAQIAAAFVHDMGIASSAHPTEPLSQSQRDQITYASGGDPEITDHKLERVAFYSRTLAVPAQRDREDVAVLAGQQHFMDFGCAACHVPTWTTANTAFHPAFANRTIHPYTDLLLHDLGAGLADEKHDGDAQPQEWRTPPLWGIGLIKTVNEHERYLHDGRARGLAEAILWHGGEALAARERFRKAPAPQRAELLRFLRSL
jgi:CxxC motif-containing protein (DUF1111 family)